MFEGRFTPFKLIVNGRKGRRVIVVLGSDRKHYRVLDMDFSVRKKRQDKEKDDAEGGDGESGSGSGSDSEEDGWGGYTSGDRDGDVEMGGA